MKAYTWEFSSSATFFTYEALLVRAEDKQLALIFHITNRSYLSPHRHNYCVNYTKTHHELHCPTNHQLLYTGRANGTIGRPAHCASGWGISRRCWFWGLRWRHFETSIQERPLSESTCIGPCEVYITSPHRLNGTPILSWDGAGYYTRQHAF